MKKISKLFSILLVFAMLLSFTACGKNSSSQASYSYGLDKNGYWQGVKALELVDLCEYKGISFDEATLTVEEADLASEISTVLQNHMIEGEVYDRAIVDGDTVNMDYTGYIDGVAFKGGDTMGNGTEVTIGVTMYIDDFLEQLIGHKPGDSFDVEVTFPDDYGNPEVAGKDAVFKTTINFIRANTLPELTDEFVKTELAAEFPASVKDVVSLKAYLREDIIKMQKDDFIYDYLSTNSTIKGEVPQIMIEAQQETLVEYYTQMANSYGYNFSDFINEAMGFETKEDFLAASDDIVQENAKSCLIYQAVAEENKLKASDKATLEYCKQNIAGFDEEQYTLIFGMPYLKMNYINSQIFDLICDNAAN